MALKIAEGEWKSQEKTVCQRSDVSFLNLPARQQHLPSVLEQSELLFKQYCPEHTYWDESEQKWVFTSEPKFLPSTDVEWYGEKFIETDGAVYERKNGEKGHKLTNATIRIVKIKKIYESEEKFDERLVCAVRCQEAWGEQEKMIEIEGKNYKKIFSEIQEKFRDVEVSNRNADAIDEYLSKTHRRDAENIKTELGATFIGWINDGSGLCYQVGLKNDHTLPNIDFYDKKAIFDTGFSFREIGHYNPAIEFLWLYAHFAFTALFLRKSGIPFQFLLFVKGKTNSLKTATVSTLADVFSINREVGIRLDSTAASLRDYVLERNDTVILIDDFSNTLNAKNRIMEKNAEFLIRAIGDGKFSSKLSTDKSEKVAMNTVRAAVILTGEELPSLSESSMYRIVTLPVNRETFDGRKLLGFQNEPRILQNYFHLFIKFLTENQNHFTAKLRQRFYEYRKKIEDIFEIPRLVDIAAVISVQIEILSGFAVYCGESDSFVYEYYQKVTNDVLQLLKLHQNESTEKDIVKMFLFAVTQSIGSSNDNGLAANEDVFVSEPNRFIGFREIETDTIWLLYDLAHKNVERFYRNQGQSWTVKADTIKSELLKRNISLGSRESKFLKKSKKNPRKYFLVLKTKAVEEILKNQGGNVDVQ